MRITVVVTQAESHADQGRIYLVKRMTPVQLNDNQSYTCNVNSGELDSMNTVISARRKIIKLKTMI